jgi:XTP/dITP diphosphohydrolase
MPQNLLIATRNAKKKRELQAILSAWNVQLLTLDDIKGMPEVEEDGSTFVENAAKKAETIARLSGCITLADDSGLVVDALNGAPGVFSARFAGAEANDENNNRKLLKMMQDVPEEERTARFVCVIAVAGPQGLINTVQGVCEGKIDLAPRGNGGFGYDPLFIPSGFDKSFAELSDAEKNKISHRGKALHEANALLQQVLDTEGSI